ncbi:helix-turn-helix domain-containing protein [Mycolicibacterium sp.]|uniref:helix-turn-helix domain-containing protein n=1 Tax=Mycolicibacterium sp. TaxID=2320850 RepID=UPI003D134CCD
MTRRVLRGFSPTRFADLRRRRGLTIDDLARLSARGTSTLYAWESGARTPQVDILALVMAILDRPIADVIDLTPDERYPGDWRVIRGMTQPELAAAAGITTTTLRKIERAAVALTDRNAAAIARALGISPDAYRAAWDRARSRPPGTPV